ncbi:MAG: cytochrome c oxidase accessory protein CcoG [Pseudomonadales bacterium]
MNDKIPLQEWAPAEVEELDLYEKREKIYTRKIEGFFQKIRQYSGWPLLLGYFLLPWLQWEGRQAVLFDLPARKFYIFGLTIWPQDLSILAFLLIVAAFALFLVTTVAGRVWCGYTCPQTVWTAIFMWIEQKFEGTRNQRIKLDKQVWSLRKLSRKTLKHLMWMWVAFSTGFTFVGYFTPVHELGWQVYSLSMTVTPFSWVVFFTLATYVNAGWMREQVCKHMCPYARFQSVMFDQETLIVSYNPTRGEPRGSRKKGVQPSALGACIDCQLCVQVCPTGIDIRDGLQYECIACALCVDACDSIMEKMDYPKGLISYTTENAIKNNSADHGVNLLRPKVLVYSFVLCVMLLVLFWRVFTIESLELNVLRDRQAVNTAVAPGMVENRYTIKVVNKNDESKRIFLSLESSANLMLVGPAQIELQAAEVESFPVRVQARAPDLAGLVLPITFVISDGEQQYTHESRFIRSQR